MAMLERLRCIHLPSHTTPSVYSEAQAMGESRRKRKASSKGEHELLKKKLAELEELQVEFKFTALNSKLTLMEHYQEPKGVNYR